MSEKQFRFEELDAWRKATEFSRQLFTLADVLEQRKCFPSAEQMRAATLSITNNIAEG